MAFSQLEKSKSTIQSSLEKLAAKGKIVASPEQVLSRLAFVEDLLSLDSDLVIEAIAENKL